MDHLQAMALVLGEFSFKATFHLGALLPELPINSYASKDIAAIGPSAIRLGLFLQLCRNYESYCKPLPLEEYECAALDYSTCFPFSMAKSPTAALTFAVKYARGMTTQAMPYLALSASMAKYEDYQEDPDNWILRRAHRFDDCNQLFGWVDEARQRQQISTAARPADNSHLPYAEGAGQSSSFPTEPEQM